MRLSGVIGMIEDKEEYDNHPDDVPVDDTELIDEDSDAFDSIGATFSSARTEWDFDHQDLNQAAKDLFKF